jgi:hypothetical protein
MRFADLILVCLNSHQSSSILTFLFQIPGDSKTNEAADVEDVLPCHDCADLGQWYAPGYTLFTLLHY